MVEADDSRKLPDTVLVLPQVNEFRLSVRRWLRLPRMKKTVNADFERAIICNRIDLKRSPYKFPRYFAADVLLDRVHGRLPCAHQTSEVVVKLQVVH